MGGRLIQLDADVHVSAAGGPVEIDDQVGAFIDHRLDASDQHHVTAIRLKIDFKLKFVQACGAANLGAFIDSRIGQVDLQGLLLDLGDIGDDELEFEGLPQVGQQHRFADLQ